MNEENNANISHLAVDTIIFLFAISTLIAVIVAFTGIEKTNKEELEHKNNVTAVYGDNITTALLMSDSDVSYEIITLCKDNPATIIVIRGYTLTDADKTNIKNNNTHVDSFVQYGRQYEKTVVVNNDGTLQKIEYKIH